MPRPLVHFTVPFFLLSLLTGLNSWTVVLLSTVACTPDLDVLSRVHRSPTHSLIVVGVSVALIGVPLSLILPAPPHLVSIALLVLISHLFLDFFDDFVPMFWPLQSRAVRLETNLNSFELDFAMSPDPFHRVPPVTEMASSRFLTTGDLLYSIPLLLLPVLKLALS